MRSSRSTSSAVMLFALCAPHSWAAEPAPKKPAPATAADVLTFTNGDKVSGKFLRAVAGTVSFHSDMLGDLSVPWSKIRELHSSEKFVVLESTPGVRRSKVAHVEEGQILVADQKITLIPSPANAPQPPPSSPAQPPQTGAATNQVTIPVKSAQYVLDDATFNKQLRKEPRPWVGWNGTATAGITIVQATEPQYTYTSAVALVRTVPTVTWLNPRNRTTADFSSSYGRITAPGYISSGVYTAPAVTETSIFHADAERDQYLATRVYALAQTAFDHNYAQGLDLQQIAGAGMGWTVIKRSKQQLDLKATLQYEQQRYINSTSGTNQNLVGSTIAATDVLHLPRGIVFHQQIAYVPAFNVGRDYSANEANTFTLPAYKNFSFTVGTIDSYLNDPLPAEPPTTRNSFQFNTGITYAIKSKY